LSKAGKFLTKFCRALPLKERKLKKKIRQGISHWSTFLHDVTGDKSPRVDFRGEKKALTELPVAVP